MGDNIVIMETVFRVVTKAPAPFKEHRVEFQDLNARIAGKDVPFAFGAFNYDVKETGENEYEFKYKSGDSMFFKDFGLDNYFKKKYQELGVDMNDLTAKALSEMTDLNQFLINPDVPDDNIRVVKIKSLVFCDEDNDYPVPIDVLLRFQTGTRKKE